MGWIAQIVIAYFNDLKAYGISMTGLGYGMIALVARRI